MNKVILLVMLLALSGCNDPVDKEFNREGEKLEVVVNFSSDLERDAWEYKEGLTGQALHSPDDYQCDIVVSNRMSFREQQETLGHELMHCLYGDYHK